MNGKICPNCETTIFLRVCKSGAGYHLGYECWFCGAVISQESGNFSSRSQAEHELDTRNKIAVEARDG